MYCAGTCWRTSVRCDSRKFYNSPLRFCQQFYNSIVQQTVKLQFITCTWNCILYTTAAGCHGNHSYVLSDWSRQCGRDKVYWHCSRCLCVQQKVASCYDIVCWELVLWYIYTETVALLLQVYKTVYLKVDNWLKLKGVACNATAMFLIIVHCLRLCKIIRAVNLVNTQILFFFGTLV